jgi:hypothetical protein
MLRVLEFRDEKPVAWEVYDMEKSNGVPIYDTTDILDLILYLSDTGEDFKIDPYNTLGETDV